MIGVTLSSQFSNITMFFLDDGFAISKTPAFGNIGVGSSFFRFDRLEMDCTAMIYLKNMAL